MSIRRFKVRLKNPVVKDLKTDAIFNIFLQIGVIFEYYALKNVNDLTIQCMGNMNHAIFY